MIRESLEVLPDPRFPSSTKQSTSVLLISFSFSALALPHIRYAMPCLIESPEWAVVLYFIEGKDLVHCAYFRIDTSRNCSSLDGLTPL